MLIILNWLAIFKSLCGLYFGNLSTESILVLHMERTYIGVVHKRINFELFLKVEKREIFEKMWIFFIWTYILMILYGLYLGHPTTKNILVLHMERTYIGAVHKRINLDFF